MSKLVDNDACPRPTTGDRWQREPALCANARASAQDSGGGKAPEAGDLESQRLLDPVTPRSPILGKPGSPIIDGAPVA